MKREKIRLNFWYELIKTAVDKLLIGAIVGLAVFIGYHMLEDYKSNLVRERFLLDCRLDALRDLREKYSKLTTSFYFLTYSKGAGRGAKINEYLSNLKNFHSSSNRSCLLFSENFDERIQAHFTFHQAIAEDQVKVSKEHLPYAHFIFNDFDELSKEALWEQTLGQEQSKKRKFGFVKKQNIGVTFQANYENWLKLQKNLEKK